MVRKGYTPEQIINKLRKAEIPLSQGNNIGVVSRKIGVSDYTYYRWRKEYGGLTVDQVRRLEDLEVENSRLKKDECTNTSGSLFKHKQFTLEYF